MNKPEHVAEVEKTAVKVRRTHRTWDASESALQRTIAKFVKVMKRQERNGICWDSNNCYWPNDRRYWMVAVQLKVTCNFSCCVGLMGNCINFF